MMMVFFGSDDGRGTCNSVVQAGCVQAGRVLPRPPFLSGSSDRECAQSNFLQQLVAVAFRTESVVGWPPMHSYTF